VPITFTFVRNIMSGRRKPNKISSTSSQAEKYEILMQPFRDPDNAQELLAQITVSENEDEESMITHWTFHVILWGSLIHCVFIFRLEF